MGFWTSHLRFTGEASEYRNDVNRMRNLQGEKQGNSTCQPKSHTQINGVNGSHPYSILDIQAKPMYKYTKWNGSNELFNIQVLACSGFLRQQIILLIQTVGKGKLSIITCPLLAMKYLEFSTAVNAPFFFSPFELSTSLLYSYDNCSFQIWSQDLNVISAVCFIQLLDPQGIKLHKWLQ